MYISKVINGFSKKRAHYIRIDDAKDAEYLFSFLLINVLLLLKYSKLNIIATFILVLS